MSEIKKSYEKVMSLFPSILLMEEGGLDGYKMCYEV